jgi:hypothetical protein
MKKIISIAIWFGLFTSLLFILSYYLTRGVSSLPFWGNTLSAFDEELSAYRASNPAIPQTVIVGPSYAAGLGHIEYIYNLGLGTTSFEEHKEIINRYVRPHDFVLYLVTMREAFPREQIVRSEIFSRPARLSALLKMRMRRILNLAQYLEPEEVRNVTAVEALMVERATGLELVPPLLNHIVAGFYRWGSIEEEVSIQPLEQIYDDHPKVLFVLAPTIKISRVTADSEIGVMINRYIRNRQQFMELIAMSNLPVLDLSNALPKEMFYDFVHTKPSGKEIIRRRLLMAALHFNQIYSEKESRGE